ncbi:DUF4157 domain-containing protein [Streptomyces buecherae]
MIRRANGPREGRRHRPELTHPQTERPVQRSVVHDVLRSPGRSLDQGTRAEMEARLGADFSDVRIHTGSSASASAAEIGARAYTSGKHVVLGDGGGDKHTLAHELTHVIQQRQGPVAGTDGGGGLKVSDPSDRYEREAEAHATRVMAENWAAAKPAEMTAAVTMPAVRPSVQRAIANQHFPSEDDGNNAIAQQFFTNVDAVTQHAHQQVIKDPYFKDIKIKEKYRGGHVQNWTTKWDSFMKGGRPQLLAAAFGYAVEAIVTSEVEGSDPISKLPIVAQITRGGTRADLGLKSSDYKDLAWIDITASENAGHIDNKDDWSKYVAIFAEVTYPSLTGGTLSLMRQHAQGGAPMSEAELNTRLAAADAEHAERQRKWHGLGDEILDKQFQASIRERTKLAQSIWQFHKEEVHGVIAELLGEEFNAPTPPVEMVPSILAALGRNPTADKWGQFTTGTSVTTNAGEAWLIDHPHPRLDDGAAASQQ